MQNFRKLFVLFLALQLHWSQGEREGGAAPICHSSNWVTSKSKRSNLWSKEIPQYSLVTFGPAREWKLHEENQTRGGNTNQKKKTIELNSAQLRHGPMQLGIGNTSWQCWAMPLVVVVLAMFDVRSCFNFVLYKRPVSFFIVSGVRACNLHCLPQLGCFFFFFIVSFTVFFSLLLPG